MWACRAQETATRLRDGMRWGGWALDKALDVLTQQAAEAQQFILEQGDYLSQLVSGPTCTPAARSPSTHAPWNFLNFLYGF